MMTSKKQVQNEVENAKHEIRRAGADWEIQNQRSLGRLIGMKLNKHFRLRRIKSKITKDITRKNLIRGRRVVE